MTKIDNDFFELYKDVENYCSEMFNKEHSISEYIKKLEENRKENTAEYKTLKHLRHVRNQIAHNTNEQGFSTKKDLNDLKNFYISIKNRTDILSRNKNSSLFSTLFKIILYFIVLFIIYLLCTKVI